MNTFVLSLSLLSCITARSHVYADGGKATVHSYTFSAEHKDIEIAPGIRRNKTVINNQYPGPQIRVGYNDWIQPTVENYLGVNGTTIHWHGIEQRGTPWYDGFPSQNQCPIAPGQSFTYRFQAQQTGTAFWHAHFENENVDGLFGPIVIEDAPGSFPFHYDEDRVILLTDAYDQTSWELQATLESPAGPDGPHLDPTPSQGLACLYTSYGNATCSADSTGNGFALEFEKGKTYRLRIIAASNLAPFVFSIDGHELILVKSDFETLTGTSTVKRLPLFTGQRYEVLVKARTDVDDGQAFWMRSELQSACWPLAGNLTTDVRGIIRYGTTANATAPTSSPWSNTTDTFDECDDLPLSALAPLVEQALDVNPQNILTVNYTLELDTTTQEIVSRVDGNHYNVSVNAKPTLFQYNEQPGLQPEPGRNVLIVNNGTESASNQVRVVLLSYGAPGTHPFHLHGHHFSVLASGVGSYNDTVPLNLVNPPMRDTVTVPASGYTIIQFPATNPGVWALHCHVGWHLAEGMLAQIVELPHEIAKLQIPQAAKSNCPAGSQ